MNIRTISSVHNGFELWTLDFSLSIENSMYEQV